MLFGNANTVGTLSRINHSKRPVVMLDPRKAPTIDEFIGRPSALGNDYVLGRDGNRDEVCDLYDADLALSVKHNDKAIMERLNKIVDWLLAGHDVRLVCFCDANERCHGDSVIKQVKRLMKCRQSGKVKRR